VPTLSFAIPDMGEGVTSGQVVAVLVAVGDAIEREQSLIEVETEKATVEIPSEISGVVRDIFVKQGDTVQAGQKVLDVTPDDVNVQTISSETPTLPEKEKSPLVEDLPKEKTVTDDRPTPGGRIPVFAAPSVRKFARDIGVDLSLVKGSGPGGKISVEDVKQFSRNQKPSGSARPTEMAESGADPSRTNLVPMNNIRKATARAMSASWADMPHVTLHRFAFVDQMEKDRKKYKARVADAGGKLTVTAIMLKFTAAALRVHPRLNAKLDLENQTLIQDQEIHIGVAVDTPRGLVVPVIGNVDKKSITQLAVELAQLSKKAVEGKLSLEEMSGATFTVTNLGGLGIEYFTPIINANQVAILGLGRSRTRAEYIDGEFQPRMVMPLSLSFDHRAVDGAEGARFLAWLSDAMESSFLLALEG